MCASSAEAAVFWQDQQRPEPRRSPVAQETTDGQLPRWAPCRVVDDHFGVGNPGHDDEVVAARAILDQDDDGSASLKLFTKESDGTREMKRPPAATLHGVHQRLFGDSARAFVDERRKLLDVGVGVTPVAKQHGDRRAAAHRLGLR